MTARDGVVIRSISSNSRGGLIFSGALDGERTVVVAGSKFEVLLAVERVAQGRESHSKFFFMSASAEEAPKPLDECRPTGNPKKKSSGVGMPASIYLEQFGDVLFHAFGEFAYQVGSSLTGPTWRDVDVRVMLDKETYAAMGMGDPKKPNENSRWCAYTMAFSALGRQMTGLPIDFQLQERDAANAEFDGPRSALIMCAVRRAKEKTT